MERLTQDWIAYTHSLIFISWLTLRLERLSRGVYSQPHSSNINSTQARPKHHHNIIQRGFSAKNNDGFIYVLIVEPCDENL